MSAEPPFELLHARALEATRTAYAPYSGLKVGAAALLETRTDDGETTRQILTGANVENASYGLTLCAETVLVGAAVNHNLLGGENHRLVALAVVNQDGEQLSPCGRCRQVLAEFADPDTLIMTAVGPLTMDVLLPHSFGPTHLPPNHTDTTTRENT